MVSRRFLGAGVATKRIKSGQQLRVDGDVGTVTLSDEIDIGAIGEARGGL